MLQKVFSVILIAVFLVVAGCSGGTHSRGQFTGHVVGSTEEQITSKLGKPEEVERQIQEHQFRSYLWVRPA